jgi:hypothetical protein
MFTKAFAGILGLAICSLPVEVLAQMRALGSPQNSDSVQDNRLIPVHAKICDGNVVDKFKLFVQLSANASPPLSDKLKFSVGDWRKLVTDKNFCPQFSGCAPKDAQSIESIRLAYTVFVQNADREGYYHPSNPNLTIGEYFRTTDNRVDPIYCTGKDQLPATPPSSPLDANSPVRLRGISDDLWIDQKHPLFSKTTSAAVSYALRSFRTLFLLSRQTCRSPIPKESRSLLLQPTSWLAALYTAP